MVRVFLGLGSNIGDRERFLQLAGAALDSHPHLHAVQYSLVYETMPWGRPEQPRFLNQVAGFRTSLGPRDILGVCRSLENEAGRLRRYTWGPRTLDADILLYGRMRMADTDLIIPHPQLCFRRFVLMPLTELVPEMVIPGTRLTAKECLRQCPDAGDVSVYHQSIAGSQ